MRKQSTIAVLMFASIAAMMVANPGMPARKHKKKQADSTAVAVGDSVFVDSLGNEIISTETDTTQMDSLQKAIWKHNKVVDDSIRLDSINRKKSGGIDAPVSYQADDSLVYDAHNKVAHLYGNSNVKYENMDLTSDRISMDLDKSNVKASGTPGLYWLMEASRENRSSRWAMIPMIPIPSSSTSRARRPLLIMYIPSSRMDSSPV